MTAIELALRAYLVPLTRTRAFVISIVLMVFFLGITALAFVLGAMGSILGSLPSSITEDMIRTQRRFILAPGVALGAILLGELPLREGIRHRTLLYPLLGPVPRSTLAAVRTLATGGLLALGAVTVSSILYLITGDPQVSWARESLAIVLGAFAYTALFGTIHVVAKRGLIGGLAYLFLFDVPLALIPFGLRKFSLTFQLRSITGLQEDMEIPVAIAAAEGSFLVGVIAMVAVTALFTFLTARIFAAKPLGEIC